MSFALLCVGEKKLRRRRRVSQTEKLFFPSFCDSENIEDETLEDDDVFPPPPPAYRKSIEKHINKVMGLTSVQQQSSADVTTHHSCTLQQPCEPEIRECAGCGKRIVERFLLKAMDIFWHEDCLKCGCCDCRLGEVGSTLYMKANLILCKRDYLRLFGNTGSCSACNKMIPAYEMVMRAKYNVYHLECFACFACQHRSVDGAIFA